MVSCNKTCGQQLCQGELIRGWVRDGAHPQHALLCHLSLGRSGVEGRGLSHSGCCHLRRPQWGMLSLYILLRPGLGTSLHRLHNKQWLFIIIFTPIRFGFTRKKQTKQNSWVHMDSHTFIDLTLTLVSAKYPQPFTNIAWHQSVNTSDIWPSFSQQVIKKKKFREAFAADTFQIEWELTIVYQV